MRYVCIHGHFYQPPRENAWLEHIDLQDSAYPYHDWNERITAECYAPNARARILDGDGLITSIVNNYSKISFNFGPTLLSWMEQHNLETYNAILEADKESQKNFSGHGNAIAQAYCHMILPLANRRDKYTAVLWGIRDFKRRFGRNPEGMWLPEMAVDLETLDIMAELGIKFTLLAPHQASAVSRIGTPVWSESGRGRIDTTMPYLVNLSRGRQINIFFYDEGIARSVAFSDLLTNGENFARNLMGNAPDRTPRPQLVHIATDGETYGHHHRFGEMALAYAIRYIEATRMATVTNYGEYLEMHPPLYEVRIAENTSWSCAHGIERWRSNCGDNGGRGTGWTQEWRGPLRTAFDWLRDTVAPRYEAKARQLFKEPWVARNEYLNVIVDRSPETVREFLAAHANHELDAAEQTTALRLLELQRHAILMYSSDGWFFDEISDIETLQVIQHAGRVVQLAEVLFGDKTEAKFVELLGKAKSNVPERVDGGRIYGDLIEPAIVDLAKVAGHFAVSSLFNGYAHEDRIYCYSINCDDYRVAECGNVRSAVGRVRITSDITLQSVVYIFGVIHFGDQNLNAGVAEYRDEETYQTMVAEVIDSCTRADFPQTIRVLDKFFGNVTYSLRSLFHDEQRNITERILESALGDSTTAYRQLYQHHYPLMRFLMEIGYPLPREFQAAAEVVLNSDLTEAMAADVLDVPKIRSLLNDMKTWKVGLVDTEGLGYVLHLNLEEMMGRFTDAPDDTVTLKELVDSVVLVRSLPFSVDLWDVQNEYYEMLQSTYPQMQAKRGQDASVQQWLTQFLALGKALSIRANPTT